MIPVSGKLNKTPKIALLNLIIEEAILYKVQVEITFQVNERKVSTLSTELRELFQKDGKWLVQTESWLHILWENMMGGVFK